MTTLGKSSSNIILGGDSAGAALALNIIAHAKHPHPAIESLVPKTPYRGLLLISPWVDFRTNDESWKQNGNKDMCVPKTFKAWSEAYLGGAPEDSYSTPGRAAADWWKGLQVGKVLVTAGAEECLLDSAKTLANNIEVGGSIPSNFATVWGWRPADEVTGVPSPDTIDCGQWRMPRCSHILLQLWGDRERGAGLGDRQLVGLLFLETELKCRKPL